MQPKPRTATASAVESVLAELARHSHGVVTRAVILDAGVTREELKQRVKRGTLLRVHRGVYRVGHLAPSREATYLAAVRACGGGALLAGRAAAHLWALVKGAPPDPEVIAGNERRVRGVTVRRARRSEYAAGVIRLGVPILRVPDTVVDLASHLPASELARACHEAGVRYELTPRQVEDVLRSRPNSPGAPALRRILDGDEPVTLSRLESRFLARLREAGLPLPQTNKPASGRRVDCRWPESRLTVELDSYRFHSSRHVWELDRRREREARARGDEFRRYTYGDVFERPGPMLNELRQLLPGPHA